MADSAGDTHGGGGGGGSTAGGGGGFAGFIGTINALNRFRQRAAQQGVRGKYYLKMAPPTGSTAPPPGIPVREILQQIFATKRDATTRDCVFYTLYVFVFVAVVYQINNSQAINSTNQALQNYFVSQQFPTNFTTAPKTFMDIGQYGDITAWMAGVLIPGLYSTNYGNPDATWYNGAPITPAQSPYLIAGEYYYLWGGVRVWQARVTNTSCSYTQQHSEAYTQRFARPNGACYGAYTLSNAADTPFVITPGMQGTNVTAIAPNPHVYLYDPRVVTQQGVVLGLSGWGVDGSLMGETYGTGGYPVYLPAGNAPVATGIVSDLINDGWIDAQTRK